MQNRNGSTGSTGSATVWRDSVTWRRPAEPGTGADICPTRHKTPQGAYVCGAQRLRVRATVRRGARPGSQLAYTYLALAVAEVIA